MIVSRYLGSSSHSFHQAAIGIRDQHLHSKVISHCLALAFEFVRLRNGLVQRRRRENPIDLALI